MQTIAAATRSPTNARWDTLTAVALRGLDRMYPSGGDELPHTMRYREEHAWAVGRNIRYGLIALLGLARLKQTSPQAVDLANRIWSRVRCRLSHSRLSPGDWGLALWATALDRDGADAAGRPFSAVAAHDVFRSNRASCDSVELAWILLGAEHAIEQGDSAADELLTLSRLAYQDLLALYNPRTRLFFRHAPGGVVQGVSRRIACFANQVYPLMAMSVYARNRDCAVTRAVIAEVADHLCECQGPLGQWWWLYDASAGGVVERYPVFSVHQDGMAPMALLQAGLATGTSHDEPIARGLLWVFGQNECGLSLVREADGLILRDIHQRSYGRIRRMMRGAFWCSGWRLGETAVRKYSRFTVNCECRPYHLGWALYAASRWDVR